MEDVAACFGNHTAKHTNRFYMQCAKCLCVSMGGTYSKQICFQGLFKKKGLFEHVTTFVVYGIIICENWSLTLREERRLRVFENSVLRRVLAPRGTR